MRELMKIKSDDTILQEIENLCTQVSLMKKLYPSTTSMAMANSGIELGKIWSRQEKKYKKSDYNALILAKLQVDKINLSIKEEYVS